jgi:hypothetical protein
MYESRLDDFLSAVRGGQAVLRDARGEAGRTERGQKGDVEPRVEASVVWCERSELGERKCAHVRTGTRRCDPFSERKQCLHICNEAVSS